MEQPKTKYLVGTFLENLKATTFVQPKLYLFINQHSNCQGGPGSSVGYGLNGPWIESRWGRDFTHLSRPALGLAQPPLLWVPGFFEGLKSGRGVTLTPQPLLVPFVIKE